MARGQNEISIAKSSTVIPMDIPRVISAIARVKNDKIVLLRQPDVIQWLFGDLSFLEGELRTTKTGRMADLKVLEDIWGREMMRRRRPDLKLDQQWTNKFGEHMCEELYMLLGETVTKPSKKDGYQPDAETTRNILEAKVGTYNTGGTAHEKILGSPFKYANVPRLYGKPLKIVCMGQAELLSRNHYGNLPGPKTTPEKKAFLDFFKTMKIEFVAATDILRDISSR